MLSPSLEPSGILGVVYLVSSLFMQPLLFLVPTFLMADRFPRRDRFPMRCMRAAILVAGFNLAISIAIMLGQTGGPLSGARCVLNFVVYSLYLIVLVPAAGSCFEMGFWDALSAPLRATPYRTSARASASSSGSCSKLPRGRR